MKPISMKPISLVAAALLAALSAISGPAESAAQDTPALKDVFKDDFLAGVALNTAQFSGRDPVGTELAARHFNSITAENAMKWGPLQPAPGRFEFGAADRFVAFGERHGMDIIGHTLVWHRQTPRWVFEENGRPASREVLLERMREHITTVVGRYRGRVRGWDVVNEALNEDGSFRRSPWLEIIGEDYIEHAFRFAHAADPGAELYYNDYSLENEPKRRAAVALVQRLQASGVKIHGIGTQGHFNMDWPTAAQLDDTLSAFGRLGIKVMVTELDVDVLPLPPGGHHGADVSFRLAGSPELNPHTNRLPDEVQQALAARYAEFFTVFRKHRDTLDRVTFWGVRDGDSWLNNWPVRGRTSHPLLFDRQGNPKPAFHAVIQTAKPAP